MLAVHALGAAERESDSVQAYGIVSAQAFEGMEWGAAAEVILRVYLQAAEDGVGREQRSDVRSAQADSGLRTFERRPVFHDPPLSRHGSYAFFGERLPPWILAQVPAGT